MQILHVNMIEYEPNFNEQSYPNMMIVLWGVRLALLSV